MGDMADMAYELGLNQMMDDGYGIGYEPGFTNAYFSGIGNSVRFVTCRYCHTYLLRWSRTENGWRMINEAGDIHSCKEYRKAKAYDPDPDPFNGDDGPDPAQWGEGHG